MQIKYTMYYSHFVQGDQLDQEFICFICSSVLSKPHSCQKGHTFCLFCITTWLQRNQSYPMCTELLSLKLLACNRPLDDMIQ